MVFNDNPGHNEGNWKLWKVEMGGQRPRKFWRTGPFDNTDSSIDIAVQKSLLTYKVDLSMKNIVA